MTKESLPSADAGSGLNQPTETFTRSSPPIALQRRPFNTIYITALVVLIACGYWTYSYVAGPGAPLTSDMNPQANSDQSTTITPAIGAAKAS